MITEEVMFSRTEQFAILAVNALNVLHDRYCCPDCCPQCLVLASLLTSGELDEVINSAPRYAICNPIWQTMGPQGKRVNRRWLYSRWNPELKRCACTEYSEEEDLVEPPVARQRVRVGPRTARTKACEVHRQARKKCTCRSEPAVI